MLASLQSALLGPLRSRIARNSAWYLAGLGTPFLIGIVTVPILLKALGEERFGVLTLAWSMIGYFSIFDLGLSRALTRVVAHHSGERNSKDAAIAAWSALITMAVLGLLSGLILAVSRAWLVESALRITPGLQQEALTAFYLLAVGVPITIVSTGLRGILEGHQHFRAVSIVRFCLGAFTYAGPIAVLPFSHSLGAVIGILVTGRLSACLAFFVLCRVWTPELGEAPTWRRSAVLDMLHFGGWVTVSNIIGPFINTSERFLIGGVASVVALTYYQTPNEILSRMGILPFAVAATLYPALSASFRNSSGRTGALAVQASRWLLMVLGPLTLVGILFADQALALWLGPEFATHAAPAVRWLVVVHLFGCLLQVPNTLLHAGGRPDLYGKWLMVELPIYLGLVYAGVKGFGIAGAAAVAALRGAMDLSFLLYQNARLLPETRRATAGIAGQVAITLAVLAAASFPVSIAWKLACLAAAPALLYSATRLVPQASVSLDGSDGPAEPMPVATEM